MPTLSLRIHIEQAKVQEDLREFAVVMHRRMGPLIRQQMKLLVTDVMKLTPPFGSRAARNESWNVQRRIGENAVQRDIGRIFSSVQDIASKNTRLGPAITSALQQNNMEVLGLQNSLPELLVKAKVMTSPDPSRIMDEASESIHQRFRQRGRVRGRLPYKFFVKRTSSLRRFNRAEKRDVGILKGGWGGGARRFHVHAPIWISRHFSGDVIDQTDQKENPFAVARNTVPYIQAQDNDVRIVVNALRDRQKALERQIDYMARQPQKI